MNAPIPTLNLKVVTNIRKMLERVNLTGIEAIAWCEAVAALDAEIAKLQSPPAPPKES